MNQDGTANSKSDLLLYKGGTVCDNDFKTNDAIAICSEMGYITTWKNVTWEVTTTRKWDMQIPYPTAIVNPVCDSETWSSCRFDTNSRFCPRDHLNWKLNVFLTCDHGE